MGRFIWKHHHSLDEFILSDKTIDTINKYLKNLDLIIFEPKVPVPPNNKMLPFKKTPAINYMFIFRNFNFFVC